KLPELIAFFDRLANRSGEASALIAWANHPNAQIPDVRPVKPHAGPESARTLAAQARSPGQDHLSRADPLHIGRDASDDQTIAFARQLLSDPARARAFGARDGEISARALLEYAANEEILTAIKSPDRGRASSKLAAPTYFMGAKKIVDALDPQSER